MNSTQPPAVELDHVSVRFATKRGAFTALSDYQLTINRGEFVCLLGPSGCGKSTLLRVVADLIKPTRGSVKLFGGPATTVRRRREIGFVFQAATLLPWRTAARNVRLPLELARTAKRRPSPDPVELLGLVGLAGRENAYPHELSGGMRQRVAIARALVNQPKILLMDEPFGALDEINRDRLNEELLRVWTHTGVTTLFVTHSIAEAIFLAQRVVVMDKHGRLREIVDIPLPYPRSLDIRDTAGFTDIAAHLRKTLRAD